MYSFIFSKILFQTIDIKNFEEDNQECIPWFSKRFFIKQYISKICKNLIRNVVTCFPKHSLRNITDPKFCGR